jgi:homoserine O-acetyltransferase/O-succinyltransferase
VLSGYLLTPPFFILDFDLMTSHQLSSLEGQSLFNVGSFQLECGVVLRDVPVAYKTWGSLNETADNVMIICHAFTGSADVEDW